MIEARVEILKKLRPLFDPHRYKVVYGGRGGAKSWSIARALIVKSTESNLRILCARELQLSIVDSVHRLLSDQIVHLGYESIFDVQRNTIKCMLTGSEFIFSGLRQNISKIRSMEGIDIVWVEEAEAVSDDSWKTLIPTIRKDDSEIWMSFNPREETDSTYRRFILDPPSDAILIEVGWKDNVWLPETLVREKDYLYRVDPDAAEHVWGGKTIAVSNARVLYGKVSVEPFEPDNSWDGPYQGADWGFATDPTVLVRLWIKEEEVDGIKVRDLYVEREAYGVGVEIVDTPALFDTVPDARDYVTRADNARPETISHMKAHGYGKMKAAEKGTGSVEDGVMHIRSYHRIVIHPKCTHAIQEARLWSYKTNKAGDVLPILIKKNDHVWDACRYALEPIMKRKKVTYEYKSVEKKSMGRNTSRASGGFRARSGGVL